MQTIDSLTRLREALSDLRGDGARIALVPTMGALHEGHLALVRQARESCDHVVASIFVNPAQFGPNEDLDAYPRQLAADAAMLEAEGCALLWAPGVAQMYPHGFMTSISVGAVAEHFCGASRPGHFDGVATVVAKLFNQVQPDEAFFGEKDFQQLAVIRKMAQDLDLTAPGARQIIAVPTEREADGLAMSSRNRYLSGEDRSAAARLPAAMKEAIERIEAGEDIAATLSELEAQLLRAGFSRVDYAGIADARTLSPLARLHQAPARLLVAARIGGTRLIDNMPVG